MNETVAGAREELRLEIWALIGGMTAREPAEKVALAIEELIDAKIAEAYRRLADDLRSGATGARASSPSAPAAPAETGSR